MTLESGTRGTATLVVGDADLASALGQGATDGFPPVLATARMVGLMELAASRAMHPVLAPGELSVGVTIEITHSAATPAGATVTAEATFREMEGKMYLFDLVARDPGGEIGRGTHKRAVVSSERLVRGAQKRCGAEA